MAAPTTTSLASRVPSGIKLKDGIKCVYAFNRYPTFSVWEKSTKPPGVDNGPPIPQTTMYNTLVETKAAQLLNDITDGSITGAYDPVQWNQAYTYLVGRGNEGSITCWYPDGSSLDFFGYISKGDPAALEKGKQPEITMTIVSTNFDPVNKVEAVPVLTEVAGT